MYVYIKTDHVFDVNKSQYMYIYIYMIILIQTTIYKIQINVSKKYKKNVALI